MRRAVSAAPAWWRTSALLLGFAIVFLWLPFEESTEHWVVLLAAGLCWLVAVRSLFQTRPAPVGAMLLRHSLTGALGGLAIAPTAVLLMSLKTGLHGHAIPDFTSDQILRVLGKSPVWLVGGALLGLGAALLRLARRRE